MGINKVQYGNTTLIDLTSDTVTADKLMQGYTAHDRTGALIQGTATGGGHLTQDQDGFLVIPPDGSGGGGGSSDFSTAEVTISVVGDSWIGARFGDEIAYPAGQGTEAFSGAYMVLSSSPVVSVLTYQSEATIYSMRIYNSSGTGVLSGTYSTTGGITYDDEEKVFVLTGDGTITLTV